MSSAKSKKNAEAAPEPAEGKRQSPTSQPSVDLQQLWFAALRREWSTLAVIPAHAGASALPIARALAEVGGLHRGSPVKLITAEGMDLSATARLIVEITSHAASGGVVIVALDPVITNQAGIPVALSTDAALLCVALGNSDLASARRTIELIGKDRFIGCVTTKGG